MPHNGHHSNSDKAISVPSAAGVHTPGELAKALDALRKACGLSYADLEKVGLPRSTVSDLVNKGRPTAETLDSYLRACGLSVEQRQGWLVARERALSAELPRLAEAMRVEQASPRLMGVHKPIAVPGAVEEMPTYVQRDTDIISGGVRDLLATAKARGGLVVLVGESSVGKTRCAFEAVVELMPAWWLVHPVGPSHLVELAAAAPGRMVVWLDELQNYFDGEHGLASGVLRALVTKGSVLVGTLWPEYYTAYIRLPSPGESDSYRVQREVLKQAEIAYIASALSPAETERACQVARDDARIAVALKSHDYGMIQVIAAAPQLVDRWHTADPYAAAVLTAAVDAVRLGARTLLSAEMLRAAAPSYCDVRQRAAAPPNWFEAALAYATEPVHGATAALAPVSEQMGQQPQGYVLADYLLQYLGQLRRPLKVPGTTWQAMIDYVSDPVDQARLAQSARDRLLYCYAEPLYQKAADAGDGDAAARLAQLLTTQGRLKEALVLWRAGADAGDAYSAEQLAKFLAKKGRVKELRARTEAGDEDAAVQLAKLLAKKGKSKELRARADIGDVYSAEKLANLLAKQGRVEELRTWVDATDSHQYAVYRLAKLLIKQGRVEEALTILRVRADTGDEYFTYRLEEALIEQGRTEEALTLLRTGADSGALQYAAERLAKRLAEAGQVEELRTRADAGDRYASHRLADVLAEAGRIEELRAR